MEVNYYEIEWAMFLSLEQVYDAQLKSTIFKVII